MWEASKKVAYAHAPKSIFVAGTPYLGLWLKLANVPSEPHIDAVDCVPSLNIRLQEPRSSQGPGKAFAVQSVPSDSELRAEPRGEYGGYFGTWTQKLHGCIDKDTD